MSLRLNKVANIPEVLPTTTGAGWCHYNNSASKAYIQLDGTPCGRLLLILLLVRRLVLTMFLILSESGAVVNYAGEGAASLRADKGDYFLAGMNIDQLFDEYRAATTPILIGVTAGMWGSGRCYYCPFLLFFL